MWLEIAEGRLSTGFGEQPIGWQDIAAFALLTGVTPTPSESRLILVLDRHYLSARYDEREKTKPKPGKTS